LLKNLTSLVVGGAGFEELPVEITELSQTIELDLRFSKLKDIPHEDISIQEISKYLMKK
jgi:hypothetical protein